MRLLPIRCAALTATICLASGSLWAELIIGPESGGSRPSKASSQRERAAGYQKEEALHPDDDSYGLMSPRGGSPVEEKAYENRAKAKAYQQAGEGAPLPSPAAILGGDGGQPRATESRNRARAYTGSGNAQDIDLSHVGRDGIPLVTCRDVDNVSGRIGDDSSAGSVIYIIRQGQQVKVRCR